MKTFFRPHVGSSYHLPDNIFDGRKILVVGHNHYCKALLESGGCTCGAECRAYCDACRNFTRNKIREYIDYCNTGRGFDRYMNTYTNFANCLSGYRTPPAAVWDSVAFLNLVQSAVASPDNLPTDTMYEESKESFMDVVRELLPDTILCWGHDHVYMNTPSDNWTPPAGDLAGYYTVGSKRIYMTHTRHPSRYFSPLVERRRIDRYL